MACTTGCPTKGCPSYAACLRGKGARVAYANSAGGWDYTAQKKHDAELASYAEARRQGIQPSGTTKAHTERAIAISNETGTAYGA
jgi:hypothetical protein